VDQCLAQLLGVRFTACIAGCDGLRRSIGGHDAGVIDRDIGRAMFKIAHRIAALRHQLAHQTIRLRHRARGIVDEAALQRAPRLGEPDGIGRCQRHDVQARDARFAFQKFRFRLGAAAELLYRAVVFRSEAPPQAEGPLPLDGNPRNDGTRQGDQDDDQNGSVGGRVHRAILCR